ncbi:MAG: crossover junction endodeoxyribonuclease RuvC [Akkermansia sp.]
MRPRRPWSLPRRKPGCVLWNIPQKREALRRRARGRSKTQVAFMVRALLELRETPESDAADALAIGLTHLFSADPLKAHMMERKYI